MEFLPKINKRAEPNKRAGWNFLKQIINEQGQIGASRMEKSENLGGKIEKIRKNQKIL